MQTKSSQAFPLKRLVTIALLSALAVVAKRFLGFNNQFISASFGFVPIAISGMLLGPLGGALTAVIADLIGARASPKTPKPDASADAPGLDVQSADQTRNPIHHDKETDES